MAAILDLPEAALAFVYLVAGVMFIQGLRDMTHPRTAPRGTSSPPAGWHSPWG
ncbi:hypothetical protein ACFQL0_17160 [Haloplanus litoreus]|uniref:hypothetical protein n=1 Tax=Haloplanus litoreus TaxID=767515 RepID=UPI00361ECDA1